MEQVALKKNIPMYVTIELLTTCNWKCKHCYIPHHDNYGLEFEVLKNMLYDLRKLGTYRIIFTGGEVFLRNDIFDILKLARDLYFEVAIYSNASLLNEEKIKRLSDLNIAEFSTTVFSMHDEIHDNIVQRKGALKNTINNILMMKNYDIPVIVKTPIMKENFSSYEDVFLFCNEHGFLHVLDPKIKRRTDGNNEGSNMMINKSQLCQLVGNCRNEISKQFLRNEDFVLDELICRPVKYSMCITASGDVVPCISWQYKVGNILEQPIEMIWKNSEKLKFIQSIKKRDLVQCCNCEFNKNCMRCPGDSLLENGDLFGCNSISRFVAESVYETIKCSKVNDPIKL